MTDSISVADRQIGETAVQAVKDVETEIQAGDKHRQVVKIGSSASIGVGSKSVTVAGTAEPLSAVSIPCSKVFIVTRDNNVGKIFFGDSSVTSTDGAYAFAASSFPVIEIDNLNKIYINGNSSGDGVQFTWLR